MSLHQPEQVFSARHVPTWLMLTFAAGYVNATTFFACERFVTHVTGTVTRIGTEVARLAILLDFVVVLTCFLMGAMVSTVLINGRAHRGLRPLHAVPLLVVAATTSLVALLGHLGVLGRFGGDVDELGDFLLLSLLSFASGLQNAAVATSTGLLVRTTHLTGPATDLGIHLAEIPYLRGQARRTAQRHALLRAGKIVAFALGAAGATLLVGFLGYLAYLVPAIIVLTATIRSFLPQASQRQPSPPHPAEPLTNCPGRHGAAGT